MISSGKFDPWAPLFEGTAHPSCCASVIVPVRNEQASLAMNLDTLACQTALNGHFLDPFSFEVLLLLNNCTDGSVERAKQWTAAHPDIALHIAERQFDAASAHVGTARRWLMDTAWHRLTRRPTSNYYLSGILSTDSDTAVRSDWIARNLQALRDGADAVGGVIVLRDDELQALPSGVRQAYYSDRTYQSLVAQLEDLIDPQDGDPCPRHLEHFGASLACTPEAYAKAGGMPDVQPLEDVAFVDRLRRQGARIRHDPTVTVLTSARFDGRAQVGLSFQLRQWQHLSERHEEHRVLSARWLIHRFGMMSKLRCFYHSLNSWPDRDLLTSNMERISAARINSKSLEDFLIAIDSDRMIEDTFQSEKEQPISAANREIQAAIDRLSSGDVKRLFHVTSL